MRNPPARFIGELADLAQVAPADNIAINDFQTPRPPDLRVGDSVKHPQFGVGTILEIAVDETTVAFDNGQTRRLSPELAALEKL